ncbi:MAG: hypothetical protein ACYS3S_15235 [Planctomycetota bacterium]|jgi:hypothetical protein
MIWKIATKEILQNLLSYKFSIIVILSTILILVSIFVMYGDYCLAVVKLELFRQHRWAFSQRAWTRIYAAPGN